MEREEVTSAIEWRRANRGSIKIGEKERKEMFS